MHFGAEAQRYAAEARRCFEYFLSVSTAETDSDFPENIADAHYGLALMAGGPFGVDMAEVRLSLTPGGGQIVVTYWRSSIEPCFDCEITTREVPVPTLGGGEGAVQARAGSGRVHGRRVGRRE
jgi:hypothetical protein